MKKKLKYLSYLVAFITIPFLTTSCYDKDPMVREVPTPTISAATASFFYTSTVVITGTKFGTTEATVTEKDPYIRTNREMNKNNHLVVSQSFTNATPIIHNNVAKVRKFTESRQ